MGLELRQMEALVRHVVQAPHRPDRELQHAAERELEGNGEAGAQIALAVAAGDAVHGQHHHVDARFLRALHHGAIEAPVLVEIELIGLRRGVGLAQLLQAHRTERGNAEHRAVLGRRGRHRTLARMVEEPLQRGR
jgi:hypothetical protein